MFSSQVVCRGLIITGLSLFLLVGCQSRTNRGLSNEENAASSGSVLPLDLHASTQQSTWETLLLETGEEGQDYDPHTILVAYQRKSTTSITGGNGLTTTTPRDTDGSSSVISLADNEDMAALTDSIERALGIIARREIYVGEVNLASFAVPVDQDSGEILQRLRSEFADRIAYAVYDPIRHADYLPNDPDIQTGAAGELWSHFQIGCPDAWDITMGDSDVIVAVVDTGARLDHEELSAQVINPLVEYPTAYCDVVNNDKSIEDADGHGTFISGVIAAEANNGLAIAGVAPDCRVLPIKISNDGDAYTSDIIAGCLLAQQLGADVINLSFGGDTSIPAEELMVNQVTAAGCLFVTSAGNDGVSTLSYPAAFANALAVGSTGYYDSRTVFSNWGSYVDIAAPGIDLKSCSHTAYKAYEYNGQGTSYSAPMVAAAAALLWSYKPELTIPDVRTILESTGSPTTGFLQFPAVPRLDIGAALASIEEVITPSITGVNVKEGRLVGSAPGLSSLPVSVVGAVDVSSVRYILDVAPLFTFDGKDRIVESTNGPGFSANLAVPTGAPNQIGRLVTEYYSSTGHSGPQHSVNVYVFNLLGEVDGDGVVTLADFEAIAAALGTSKGMEEFNPFCDSNFDNIINEADIAAVGYHWEQGAVGPDITVVSYTPGTQGTPITFTPEFTGTPPVSFTWEFGAACNPGTSTETEPVVLLGNAGTHPVSVTATNAWGSDEYSFNLEIGAPVGDPPYLYHMNPHHSDEFREVVLSVYTQGTEPLTYEWDFGDACLPSTGTGSPIVVTLQEVGNYVISVTLSNAVGSDYEEYDFEITQKVPPTAVIDSSSFYGPAPLSITFDGARTEIPYGSIELYEWSWDGDEVYEESSESSAMEHTFVTEGVHTVRMRVTDELGYTDDVTTQIEIVPYIPEMWLHYEICDFGNVSTGYREVTSWALVDGRPALVWVNTDTAQVEYIHATVAQPTSADEWVKEVIASETADAPYGNLSMAELAGHAAVAVTTNNNDDITYYTPGGEDWSAQKIRPPESTRHIYPSLASIAGKPAIIYQDLGTYERKSLWYCSAATADPASYADWTAHEVFVGDTKPLLMSPSTQPIQFIESGGLPLVTIMVDNVAEDERWILQATSTQPTEPADWDMHVLTSGFNGHQNHYLASINGKPALYCEDLVSLYGELVSNVFLADTTSPTGVGSWYYTRPGGTALYYMYGLASEENKPAILWKTSSNTSTFQVTTADVAFPTLDSEWSTEEVSAVSGFAAILITTADGHLAIFVVDPASRNLYYYYRTQE